MFHYDMFIRYIATGIAPAWGEPPIVMNSQTIHHMNGLEKRPRVRRADREEGENVCPNANGCRAPSYPAFLRSLQAFVS